MCHTAAVYAAKIRSVSAVNHSAGCPAACKHVVAAECSDCCAVAQEVSASMCIAEMLSSWPAMVGCFDRT